jgi:DNA-binding beta-propeller fold protein YncE
VEELNIKEVNLMVLGQGKFKYRRVENWAKIPPYFEYKSTPEVKFRYPLGMTGDSKGRIFVSFRNASHPVIMLDLDGNFLYCWGENYVFDAHDICVGPDDSVYVADRRTHTVEKFTTGGVFLGNWGRGRFDPTPTFSHKPFNMPAGIAFGPSGEMYVADGYGNSVVHKFSPDGKLLKTWGGPGNGTGQFNIPHALAVDKHGNVYVADRMNDRIQKFTAEGEHISTWTDVVFPMDIHMDRENDVIYVLESLDYVNMPQRMPSHTRISIRNLEGAILSEFGGRESEGKGGVLEIGHALWVDPQGNIYEAEILANTRFQKFVRVK